MLVKHCLKDFETWQSLPPKDALTDYCEVKSKLEKTASISTDVAKVNHPTVMSFVKPDYSELFTLVGNQGRLEFNALAISNGTTVSGSGEEELSSDVQHTLQGDVRGPTPKISGQPPNKRKKLS